MSDLMEDHRAASAFSSQANESSRLLGSTATTGQQYGGLAQPAPHVVSQHSYSQGLRSRAFGKKGSAERRYAPSHAGTPLRSSFLENRTWYDQFTSTDWIRDTIADADRVRALRARRDTRGRLLAIFDGAQGWILVAIVSILTAGVAYLIDIIEATIFDIKTGYCSTNWLYGRRRCCNASICDEWISWSALLGLTDGDVDWTDHIIYTLWVIVLALLACGLTLFTKTTITSHVTLSTFDENLGAVDQLKHDDDSHVESLDLDPVKNLVTITRGPVRTYYPASGSGVAEVKVILSGFILRGYLGVRTLVCKSAGLILSVASGLSIGKEGPLVHIATCIGNITSRIFHKYNVNDGKRRELLSASAAAGVAVAFGAPIGGVLFSLEEVSYYFPPKTLFRTFFCCIVAALSLKFLDPYGTKKIVLFEVRYFTDWHLFEIVLFAVLGVLGGVIGALVIKCCRIWAKTFRRTRLIKDRPAVEVLVVAIITGLLSFWNRYTRMPIVELLWELAAPCDSFTDDGGSLCATQERIPSVVLYLCWALVVKYILTVMSFGIKVPAGIYVPSMVIGGLVGRIVGHATQLLLLEQPAIADFVGCPADGSPESCVVPGVYALVAAGATMCGVTRLSVTLAVILFELTGSLEHVLPFSLGILIAKWTADAIEPASIYDLLLSTYPYLNSSDRPVFLTELTELVPEVSSEDYIDISDDGWVPATQLRQKLQRLHMSGELDGGFPIVQHGNLKGLIPAPDLEYALDGLESEGGVLCYMDPHAILSSGTRTQLLDDEPTIQASRRADFSDLIDPAPIALDLCSPLDLVFECFTKLGLRYVCVLRDGQFVGMVHKKAFVKHVKDVHSQERSHGTKQKWWKMAGT